MVDDFRSMIAKTQNSYMILSPFFRDFAKARSHFEKQLNVIKSLIPYIGHSQQARILDASCGTGDVAAMLYQIGYERIEGVDGCKAMLEQSQQLSLTGYIPFTECRWENIDKYFANNNTFDFIFILGHSLPHADPDTIQDVMAKVCKGLNAGGTFAFDMRRWIRESYGSLIQPNRNTGTFKCCGRFFHDGREFCIDERCSYESGGAQCINYRIRRVSEDDSRWDLGEEKNAPVYYFPFEIVQAKDWLIRAGFDTVEEFSGSIDWPYAVILGRKTH